LQFKATANYIAALTLVSLHNSPPYSSDFNPIEPVFAKLKVL